ncbi:MAG: DUF1593 domain-containing protein [Mariniphaga sp.]|nr:DUF1593 domain-containing protein [Mariniphaga sp.]
MKNYFILMSLFFLMFAGEMFAQNSILKPRVIVTSDGEIDDECSLVRFLLYTNEWDVEGIITSSSQYHWQGHRWAGDGWADPYLEAYAQVYPNLSKHDPNYPKPEYLRERTVLGNVKAEGEMEEVTAGSLLIVDVLLDDTDKRPVWLQAWGGTNTIARALKTIEEEHPEKMEEVAKKIRFFFIWEQDSTYQAYIRPSWGKYNIQTIISDQFWAIAYQWNKILPEGKKDYFRADWMKKNILEGHGALCSLYKAHVPGSHGLAGDTNFNDGDFRSEGDSPAFLHTILTGLRNMEHPDWGGWGGRYVKVRDNTWLDPVPVSDYEYPEGRWYTGSAWGRLYMRKEYPENQALMREYFKPLARWTDAIQKDFAARADWCVQSYKDANHAPVVKLSNAPEQKAKPGSTIQLSAKGTSDPDGDELSYKWWQYLEAGTYKGNIDLQNADQQDALFTVPEDTSIGEIIHIICEVKDNGSPQLTRYQRTIVTVIK